MKLERAQAQTETTSIHTYLGGPPLKGGNFLCQIEKGPLQQELHFPGSLRGSQMSLGAKTVHGPRAQPFFKSGPALSNNVT